MCKELTKHLIMEAVGSSVMSSVSTRLNGGTSQKKAILILSSPFICRRENFKHHQGVFCFAVRVFPRKLPYYLDIFEHVPYCFASGAEIENKYRVCLWNVYHFTAGVPLSVNRKLKWWFHLCMPYFAFVAFLVTAELWEGSMCNAWLDCLDSYGQYLVFADD